MERTGGLRTQKGNPLEFGMVSCSQIRRLNDHLCHLKDNYDSLKIKQLSEHGTVQDAAKLKQDEQTLD